MCTKQPDSTEMLLYIFTYLLILPNLNYIVL